jgi:hypothetical protein
VTAADASARAGLRVIDADASPEEVAAIVAAVTAALAATAGPGGVESEPGSRWVTAARLRARRAGTRRGEWRLSARMGSRART